MITDVFEAIAELEQTLSVEEEMAFFNDMVKRRDSGAELNVLLKCIQDKCTEVGITTQLVKE